MSGLARGFRGLIRPSAFDITSQSASVKVGATYQIPYIITPSDVKNKKVIWTSSDDSIATVSNNGLISAIDIGSITITGRTEDLSLTDTISVDTYVIHTTGVTLDKSSVTLYQGYTVKLNATVTPSDTSYPGVTWYSSNTSVATVSNTGLVTYVGEGNCVITVTTIDGGYTATCSIECIAFIPVDTCFGCTGGEQSITLEPHSYCIEVWGAQGGTYSSNLGGYGGYAAGTIDFIEQTTLYIYVGGQPASITAMNTEGAGGYNGGGKAKTTCYSGTSTYAQPGGGGTDVRYNGNTLCHRFIVAGGGGGSASVNLGVGAAGGGATGCSCTGIGGTQTSAGTGGSFGQGGNGCLGTNYKYHAGGGGGGWYGGGANTTHTDSYSACRCAVGGGSAYTYTSSTCGNHPNKACLGDLPLMTDAVCCPGSGTIPTPSGGTQTGRCGHGCVRIRSL